jgi:hypothetical protein
MVNEFMQNCFPSHWPEWIQSLKEFQFGFNFSKELRDGTIITMNKQSQRGKKTR